MCYGSRHRIGLSHDLAGTCVCLGSPGPRGPGHLDGGDADAAGAALHEQRLAGLQLPAVDQGVMRRAVGEDEGGGDGDDDGHAEDGGPQSPDNDTTQHNATSARRRAGQDCTARNRRAAPIMRTRK